MRIDKGPASLELAVNALKEVFKDKLLGILGLLR